MQPSGVGETKNRWLVMLILLLGVVAPLQAGDFGYRLGYTATRSDNIARAPSNERSETFHSYLAGLVYLEQTADVVARVLARVVYRDYQSEAFSDQTVFNMNSSLLWNVSPQRFTWTAVDVYGQSLIDTAAVNTPANRTKTNVFSTGPDVYVQLNPVHTLAFGARADTVSTGQLNTDNDRLSGTASWLYQATAVSTYSLNFQRLDVKYDDSLTNVSYVSRRSFLRAEYSFPRSQYRIDLGASNVDPDRGRSQERTLARLSWTRQLTPESSFRLFAAGEFTDTGTDILAASNASAPVSASAPTTLSPNSVTSDAYSKRASIFYAHRGGQFGLNFFVSARDLDYETAQQDSMSRTAYLATDFFYSATTSVKLFTGYAIAEYQNLDRRNTDRNSGVSLNYRLARAVTLGLMGQHSDRSSTVAAGEYQENRVLLSIQYSSPLFMDLSANPYGSNL